MEKKKASYLCQPDSQKGCSICCGLFNLQDISKNNLSQFLNSQDKAKFFSLGARDEKAHICPFQSFIRINIPGCSAFPSEEKKNLRDLSLFGAKICSDYFCPAHKILGEPYKDFLINNVSDWYNYSLAIVDPESFIWLINKFYFLERKDLNKKKISEALDFYFARRAVFLNQVPGVIFYYSISEYNLGKGNISLLSGKNKSILAEKEEISARIEFILES